MALAPGTKLGPYEILMAIGAGGMGEVYRARDTRLGRDVALKISNENFTERFEREARSIAALNHPNICHLYDVGPNYLVMELIDGEPIKGPFPLEKALDYARQIADAIDAAHERGIVHRDLKPANILLTSAGVVKVLDFGLAKNNEIPTGDPANSPTVTISRTQAGMILGTASYMAPEQARGKIVDKRADIWAFGCVFYEMLTGKQLFSGESVSDILAAILGQEPDLSPIPEKTRRVIARCLEKEPRKRLRDIGDAWDLLGGRTISATPARSRLGWAAMGLAVVCAALTAALWRTTRPIDHPLTRLTIDLGPDAIAGQNTTVAVSPDGRRIVYPVRGPDRKQRLATRTLDQVAPTVLDGTENGFDPFFAPDSQWIGFFADGQMKKIAASGGAPVTLCPAPLPAGASWSEDGTIIASLNVITPLYRVSAAGGTPVPVTKLGAGDVTHRWPHVLPGGEMVIFTASGSLGDFRSGKVEVAPLRGPGQPKILAKAGYFGRYLRSGYLLFVRDGTLFAARFDPGKQEILGTPGPVVQDLDANSVSGGGQFDFSETGTMMYLPGSNAPSGWQVVWLDGTGKTESLLAKPGRYIQPRLSPDGRKLAFVEGTDLYLFDIPNKTTSRVTFSGNVNMVVWSPDSRHFVFRESAAEFALYWARSDGGGERQKLLDSPSVLIPWSFSPDGTRLAYYKRDPEFGNQIYALSLDVSDPDHPKVGKSELAVRTTADELTPQFSPDGHWIATRSNESGSNEIFVRPFPTSQGGKWQISTGGGLYALWSRTARQLFYESLDNRIMVVDYSVNGDSFQPSTPRLWSDHQLFYPGNSNWDIAPDGKRFLILSAVAQNDVRRAVSVVVLENFADAVRRAAEK